MTPLRMHWRNGNYIFQYACGGCHLLYWWEISEPWRGKRQILSAAQLPWHKKEEVLKRCQTLRTALTRNSQADIDGTELAMEMYNFPPLPSKNMTNMDQLTFLHEKKLTEIYPKMWVALRIFATLSYTLAAAEIRFSKLKLTKTYLRSIMMQSCPCGLSIISINHRISSELSYNDVIEDFAGRKSRKAQLERWGWVSGGIAYHSSGYINKKHH